MRGDPKSVEKQLDDTRRDRSKIKNHDLWRIASATINQIKTTGKLIETIENLDEQNRRLEIATLSLTAVGIVFGGFSILDRLNLLPFIGYILAGVGSFLIVVATVAIIRIWLKSRGVR